MNVLAGCEYSGIVREAFKAKGHNAVSCDLLPTEIPGKHYEGDIFDILYGWYGVTWDLMIAHPPCTYLTNSANAWLNHPNYPNRKQDREEAVKFFMMLANAPIDKICIENPIGHMSTRWRKPDQIIQPWQFGHGETKATCLWLKNLPKLQPTDIVAGREQRIHNMGPSKDRGKERSRTYQGIANCMADTWG